MVQKFPVISVRLEKSGKRLKEIRFSMANGNASDLLFACFSVFSI